MAMAVLIRHCNNLSLPCQWVIPPDLKRDNRQTDRLNDAGIDLRTGHRIEALDEIQKQDQPTNKVNKLSINQLTRP